LLRYIKLHILKNGQPTQPPHAKAAYAYHAEYKLVYIAVMLFKSDHRSRSGPKSETYLQNAMHSHISRFAFMHQPISAFKPFHHAV
jgi:hypothetical protein